MVMKFSLLPWKPELVFTGLSIMGVNPQNLKFCSHVDIWDSIQNNEYFSLEGLVEVFKQLRYYKTPDIETPSYLVLKKTANYEVLFRCVYFMKNQVHCRFGVATLPWHHNPLFILSHIIHKFPSYIMRLMLIINLANMISCSRTLYDS
ncbi:unnamed protein product [Triticum turgidum subsp. durum]|uniref:Uncharacterized protein n=1 Tax=Triticum turgidum subsp. durum TaxID=4567 RepID=A0A9R0ZHG8_TRITD|nr:unnamed protein product [Triticum turgidum subsp. durum]